MPRIRLRLAKGIDVAFLDHSSFLRELHHAVGRASLPVAHGNRLDAPFRIVGGLYLPRGYTSRAEYVDMYLEEPVPPSVFSKQLSQYMTRGIEVLWTGRIPERAPHLRASYREFCYTVFGLFDPEWEKMYREKGDWWLLRRKGDKEKAVNLKNLITGIHVTGVLLRFFLKTSYEGNPTPEEVVQSICPIPSDALPAYRFERTDALLLPVSFPRASWVE